MVNLHYLHLHCRRQNTENLGLAADSIGFSLLELLIVLGVIAILIIITYPTYTHHVIASRRNEAKIGLLQFANKLENYASLHNSYAGATLENLEMPLETD